MESHITISGDAIDISDLTAIATSITFTKEQNLSLVSTKIDKKLYCPNELTVEIQVANVDASDKEIPDMATIAQYFLDAQISLWFTENKPENSLAENFQIHEVEPSYGSAGCILTLKAYSWDKLLTYDKYCETWVGKCLSRGILAEKIDKFIHFNGNASQQNYLDNRLTNLQHLAYANCTKEKIQPYLIQYNESFYDMLRRTAYRCGEFLFFEGRMLHFGIDVAANDCETVTVDQMTSRLIHRSDRTISPFHRTYQVKDSIVYGTKDYYDMKYAAEEYFDKISKSPATMEKQFGSWPNKIAGYLSYALTQYSLPDMIMKTGTKIASDYTNATIAAETANSEFNKLNFASENANNNDHYVGNDYYPFVSSNIDGQITSDFYFKNQQGSQRAKDLEVCATLKSSETKIFRLGQFVTMNSKTYIVTEVYKEEKAEKDDSSSYILHAIPYDPQEPIYPPFQQDIPVIKEAEAQVAYVTDADDPKRNGRVRIKFPWQKDAEDASPWIRTSNPMAAKGCGIHFELCVGEEVMVNFTQGNMEAPFVTGSLYNEDSQVRWNKIVPENKKQPIRSIASSNGHAIMFNDPQAGDAGMFTSSFAPIMTVIGRSALDDSIDQRAKKKEDSPTNGTNDSVSNDLQTAQQTLTENEKKIFDTGTTTPGSGNEKEACAAIRWKKEKDMMLQFYQEAASKILNPEDIVYDGEWKTKKYAQQVENEGENGIQPEANNEIQKLWYNENELKNTTKLDLIHKNLEGLIKDLQTGADTLDLIEKPENDEQKDRNNLKRLYMFYTRAMSLRLTKEDLSITDDMEKNAKFYIHRKEIILGVKHLASVTDAGLAQAEDSDFTHDGTNDSFNNGDRSDCTLDIKDYVPRVKYNSDQDFPALAGDNSTNLLDMLKYRIEKVENAIKGLIIPADISGASSDYNDYKTALENFKAEKANMDSWTNQLATNAGQYHAGGITLCDDLGLYKITMSSHSRNISIASPLGDIKLDAFTGITINAPAGDVKIKGKNITLEAGNNLKLISGTNKVEGILQGKKGLAKTLLGGVADAAVDIGAGALAEETGFTGIVDLSALRTVFECLIKPVEGTLQVHSGNNLILEAGDKKAALPVANLNKSGNKNMAKRERLLALYATLNLLNSAQASYNTLRTIPFNANGIKAILDMGVQGVNNAATMLDVVSHFEQTQTPVAFVSKLLTDNENKAKKYTHSDICEIKAKLLPNPVKAEVKHLLAEMNAFARQVASFYKSIKGFKDNIKETLDAANITTNDNSNVWTCLKGLRFLDQNGNPQKITCVANNNNLVLSFGNDATITDENFNKALFEIAKAATTEGGIATGWQSLFGINKKPIAQYDGVNWPEEVPGDSNAWSTLIDNLKEPEKEGVLEYAGKTLFNDVNSKLFGDSWGAFQGIVDDINGLTAEQSGKVMIANLKDHTFVLTDGGLLDPQANANLENFKKLLKSSFRNVQREVNNQNQVNPGGLQGVLGNINLGGPNPLDNNNN